MKTTDDLKGMFPKINIDFIISIISSYGRRFAEPYYDKISQTPFFQKLKQQDSSTKHLIEALLNTFVAFIDQAIDESTPFRKLLKEIFMDSSSELNKRLMNGESVQKILIENAEKISDPEEKKLLTVLLAMDEKQLAPFLEQLIYLPDEERLALVKFLKKMSPENIIRWLEMSQETRVLLFEACQETPQTPQKIMLKSAQEDINQWLKERLERKKLERKNQKGGKK